MSSTYKISNCHISNMSKRRRVEIPKTSQVWTNHNLCRMFLLNLETKEQCNCLSVSKTFYQAGLHPHVWKTIELHGGKKRKNEEMQLIFWHTLLPRTQNQLESLIIRNMGKFTSPYFFEATLRHIVQTQPRFRRLRVLGSHWPSIDFDSILKQRYCFNFTQ
jgi:hypothetical protein